MSEQGATQEGTDIILQERVKLLRVVVDKRRYKGSDVHWKVTELYYKVLAIHSITYLLTFITRLHTAMCALTLQDQ